jgi:hypothetical protein
MRPPAVADALRELAEQHPGLLTVTCAGFDRLRRTGCADCVARGDCRLRRLATLEELLEANRMMLWYEHGWCAESEDESREVHGHETPWEAAARLLVELEAGRG